MMGTAGNTEILHGVKPRARRQYRSKLERRRIVEESHKPGASVAVVARTHGVNANQVFQWRKLYREGLLEVQPALAQLLPVRITEVADEERGPTRPYTGGIHVEVGRVRLRVEGSVDPDSLRLILEQLGR
jgi:transposase